MNQAVLKLLCILITKNKNQLVKSVLTARDEKFKQSLFQYIGAAKGIYAINKIFDWHMEWFQQDSLKGCLFVSRS
jgi:hypothetical protein